jgi:hypothetical protein
LEYFPGLKEDDLPRYVLLSDFQTFELYDLDIDPDKPLIFKLDQLADHVQAFGFIVGQERRIFRDQDPANIQASEIMGALHDALEESGYKGHDLERFLVRLLFCLFADDTGIFQPLGIFEEYIANTREDGADLGPALGSLFQVLDTVETHRHKTIYCRRRSVHLCSVTRHLADRVFKAPLSVRRWQKSSTPSMAGPVRLIM